MATPGNIVTADGVVCSGPAVLYNVVLLPPPGISAEAVIILYDHASAGSGDVICELTVCERSRGRATITWEAGYHCALGIYADITGTGAKVIVDAHQL